MAVMFRYWPSSNWLGRSAPRHWAGAGDGHGGAGGPEERRVWRAEPDRPWRHHRTGTAANCHRYTAEQTEWPASQSTGQQTGQAAQQQQ